MRVDTRSEGERATLLIDPADLGALPLGALVPVGSLDEGAPRRLGRGPDGRLALPVEAPRDATAQPERAVLRWFAIQRRWPPASPSAGAR